jgi:ribosomal protein L16 Arg81 hydroxylase
MIFWDREDLMAGKMNIYPKAHCMFRRVLEDAVSPDRRLFPHYDATESFQAEIKQGEILYFPSMWPHYTTATSNSISIGKRSHAHIKDDNYEKTMQQFEKNISPPWATVDETERRHQFSKGYAIDRKAIFEEMEKKGTYDDPEEWYIAP